ncbi:hypothetical protein JFL43_18855 [Viridibacillus sp. YIM B01967]|uniref:Uncharacterized protein n=1 Tax=Viridibacillus soli TaxID=2798301 RepID=A0ABS1HBQ9_9BACL|nr:hypothetical protein [Viridibacillus soli]MBK3496884.1 hypothetical protein [Viridibacillus soli]
MFKNVSKSQFFLSPFFVIICFLQSYNHWGEKQILSLVFLISGILLFTIAIINVIVYKKRQSGLNKVD